MPRGGRGLAILLAVAAVARFALLLLPPLLSEDLWRYLWDGIVQGQGLNPYALAPNDPGLDGVASSAPGLSYIRAHIGHAHIPTVYPPAAQLAFRVITGVSHHPTALRALMIAGDLVAVVGIWFWAVWTDRDPRVAALYAFAPVTMLESAVGGHVDALGVAGLVWGGAWIVRGRPVRAGAALAIAVGTKLLPLLAIPVMIVRARTALAAMLLGSVALTLPYLSGTDDLMAGLSAYGHRWRGNDGMFALIAWPFEQSLIGVDGPLEPSPAVEWMVHRLVGRSPGGQPGQIWPDELALAGAKAVAASLMGLWTLWLMWRRRDFEGFFGPLIAGLLLLAPVIHPWYLIWVLPFACLGAARSRPGWPWPIFLWSMLVWIAYLPRPEYLRSGEWTTSPAWRAVEYLPVWLGLLVVAFRARSRAPAPETAHE